MPVKLCLVVRTDLGMGRGKVAAQVAHGAVAAALASQDSPEFVSWLQEGQPKVVLRVPSGEHLHQIVAAGRAAGLPVQVVHDAGRTQVAAGAATCCALGPADSARVDAVTASLPLL
jgi:PTH2 family peptidyl-tRNA hydrolase